MVAEESHPLGARSRNSVSPASGCGFQRRFHRDDVPYLSSIGRMLESSKPRNGLMLTSLNSRAAAVLVEHRTDVEILEPKNGLKLTSLNARAAISPVSKDAFTETTCRACRASD